MAQLLYAQESTAAPSKLASPSPLMSFVPFILIFVVFYFLMIRPQQSKLKKEQEMLKEIKEGDEIYTRSGMLGTVKAVNDTFVTLEIAAGVRVKLLKSQIGGLAQAITQAGA